MKRALILLAVSAGLGTTSPARPADSDRTGVTANSSSVTGEGAAIGDNTAVDDVARTAANKAQTEAAWAGRRASVAQIWAYSANLKADTARSTAASADRKAISAQESADLATVTAKAAKQAAGQALIHSQQTRASFDDFAGITNVRFRGLDGSLIDMRKEYRAGIAATMAGTHAVASAIRGHALGVGLGTFGGQSAISFGLAAQIGRASVTANLAHGAGGTGGAVGFSLPLF